MTGCPFSPARPERQQARSEAKRTRLIEAGIAAFGIHGYEGASLRDIARRSGAGLAAVSYHFGGKRELYLACAGQIAENVRGVTASVRAALSTQAPPVARVEAALEATVRNILQEKPQQDWPRFFMRCEAEDAEAFGIIFEGALSEIIAGLAQALSETPMARLGEDELRFRIGALIIMCFSLRSHSNFGFAALGQGPDERDRPEALALRLKRLYLPELMDQAT